MTEYRTLLSNFVKKSQTNGLLKNDGTVDTTDYISTSDTQGLLKNDGTVDTTNYLSTHQDITSKEDKSNKVTSISSSSNNTQYPSAKSVYDECETKLDKLQRTVTTFIPQDYCIGDGTWTYGNSVTFDFAGNASVLELANMLTEDGNVVDFVLTLNSGSCTIKDREGPIWSGTATGDNIRIQAIRDGQYCTIKTLDSVGVVLYSEDFSLNDTELSFIANSAGAKISFGSKQWYHTVSFIDMIYPIGSIYMSMNSINPSLIIGGEWEAIEDRFLFSTGTKHSYSGATGGSETVTLTSAQSGVPAHSHKYQDYNTTYTLKTTNRKPGTSTAVAYGTSLTAGGGATERTSSNNTAANASQAHENMPPYLTVYMWKRTG